jgi:hypothetical protein
MRTNVAVVLIIISLAFGGFAAPTEAQGKAIETRPTFVAPTPGLYVNGWPPFAVSHPQDWEEQPLMPGTLYHVAAPGPSHSPALVINAFPNAADIGGSASMLAGILGTIGKDVKILYDRPANLQDGTPAQEAEIEWVWPNGPKTNTFLLATKRGSMWIWVGLYNDQGLTGDNLKKIAYSLKVSQEKPQPVKLPADVQEFVNESLKDLIGGDIGKIMSHVSDRYLNNGMKKAGLKQFYLYSPYSPLKVGIESGETTITIFEPQGDKAYLTGFPAGKLKSGAPWPETPLGDRQIIKENGQWKWYGNQK